MNGLISLFQRISILAITLTLITVLSFIMMKLAPGDPTQFLFEPGVSVQDIHQLKSQLGLNDSVTQQYLQWITHLIHGDFGVSLINRQPVLSLILERLPATLLLTLTALALTLIIGISLGIIAAVYNGKLIDRIITLLNFIGMSTPTFWFALMAMLAFSLWLPIFPALGMKTPFINEQPIINQILDIGWHLVLPVTTLMIGSLASITKYTRDNLIKTLTEDYIRTAKAYGFSQSFILFKYALKNTALPIITILGLEIPGLFGGAFIIEKIFAWPGMGRLGVDAIFSRDYPLIMGILIFSSLLVITGNMLADIFYRIIDPRIHHA